GGRSGPGASHVLRNRLAMVNLNCKDLRFGRIVKKRRRPEGRIPLKAKETGIVSTRGIVHAAAGLDKFSLFRFEPGPRLAPFVEYYWSVCYQLPPGATHTQTVLSFPNVHLAFEEDENGRKALIHGIPK